MIDRVAFLGLGIMGAPMAANLARAGIEVAAWNRSPEKADALAAEHESVTAHPSAAEAAAAGGGVAITMVPDGPQVESVLLGDGGVAEALGSGGLAVDMSTIAPRDSVRIGEALDRRGIAFLDAPVTGSRPKAEDGTLTIMAGGDSGAFERARPLFEAMGELVVHAGPQGHGSMIKVINNTLAAVNAAALAEGLTLASAAGVDADRLIEVVGAGSGNSTMLALKARPMVDGDLEPLFKLEHMLKDVRHMITEAQAAGVAPAVAETAQSLYDRADRAGLGGLDFAAVIRAVDPRSERTGETPR